MACSFIMVEFHTNCKIRETYTMSRNTEYTMKIHDPKFIFAFYLTCEICDLNYIDNGFEMYSPIST